MYQTGKITSLISKNRITGIVKSYYNHGTPIVKVNFSESNPQIPICKNCAHFRLNKINTIDEKFYAENSEYKKYPYFF